MIAILVFTWQLPVAPKARLGPVSLSVPFSSSRVGVLSPSATTMALPMLMNNAECGPSNALQELSKRFNTDRGLSQVCKAVRVGRTVSSSFAGLHWIWQSGRAICEYLSYNPSCMLN